MLREQTFGNNYLPEFHKSALNCIHIALHVSVICDSIT